MAKRVLTSDLLIADIITPINGNNRLGTLVHEYDMAPNTKRALKNQHEFDDFSAAIDGKPITITPGGSSANTMVTLNKLVGHGVLNTSFIGIAGNGMYSNNIRHDLRQAGIRLLPEKLPEGSPSPQSATSFVVMYDNGNRAIATHPGNARDILKTDIITDDMIKNNDVVFVQGSLWEKLDHDFADRLVTERWNKDKELWLAMPTNAKFGDDKFKDKAERFKFLAPSADVILSNEEEIKGVYQTQDMDKIIHTLQEAFRQRIPEQNGHHMRKHKQVAFITMGASGARVVTAEDDIWIPAHDVDKIVNNLGAGDTAYAGFLAGHLVGMTPKASAELAMSLAAAKLQHNGPRLADPMQALKEVAPAQAAELEKKIATIGYAAENPDLAVTQPLPSGRYA